jgi:O-methyltransferase
MIKKIINKILANSKYLKRYYSLKKVYDKYSKLTMIPRSLYIENLFLASRVENVQGDIVECGVWRGGMIAGIAEVISTPKKYFLFDSFKGLPDAKEIDGSAAIQWQNNKESEHYYNNCTAEIEYAENAMRLSGANFKCVPGWFEDTVNTCTDINEIALLRLDADWYDSTMVCLKKFFPMVTIGGMIIFDDYYTWDGCSRAVHDYLSYIKSVSRIQSSPKGICYIIKQDQLH